MAEISPLVTAIIPVYNAGEYLHASVESIVTQTYKNIEIIIVNDGSTDGCMETVKRFQDDRIIIINKDNGGKSTAMNAALDIMRGEYWLIQDADDKSYPIRIERQLEALLRNENLAATFTGIDIIINGRSIMPQFKGKSPKDCRKEIDNFQLPAHDATGMYQAAKVREMRFDEELRIGQGVDFIFRVGEKHPISVIGECLYSHRINPKSVTHQDPAENINRVNRVVEKACNRRKLKFDNYKLKLPKRSKIFKHRSVDTILPYAMESVVQLKESGRWLQAIRTALFCIRLHPLDPLFYKPVIYAGLPLGVINIYKKLKK